MGDLLGSSNECSTPTFLPETNMTKDLMEDSKQGGMDVGQVACKNGPFIVLRIVIQAFKASL